MKHLELTRMKALWVVVLAAGLVFTACQDSSSISGVDNDELTQEPTSSSKSYAVQSNSKSAGAGGIIIDDFTSGGMTISAAGNNVYNFFEDASIAGGAREVTVRDAFSGQFGGRMNATINENDGTLAFYVTGRVAAELGVMYGTAIGTQGRSWSPSPNQGAGSELNLQFTLDDALFVEVVTEEDRGTLSPWINVLLQSGATGGWYQGVFNVEEGSNLLPLSEFKVYQSTAPMPAAAASDIDGIVISGGLNTYGQFGFQAAAPETNVYVSSSSVQTWDPIFPASADANWSSTVCYQSNDFGLTANWVNPHNAFEVTQDNGQPHPWDNSTFDAAWINSYNDMDSEGPGGHNWSKYETQVSGDGDFVIQLLADNCSWVYLADENGDNPQLIGYQPAVSTPGEYGVTLSGNHTLTFVIFDGGGLAGGKFRLETTDNPPPPIVTNTAPVADAGADQTLEATGPTTSVTLSGSGTDADGDALSYSWSNGSSSASTTVDLGVGTHTFTLTVTDTEGASDSDDVTITINDTTEPTLSYFQTTGELWPPNHKMVLVATGISASDLVDGATSVEVTVTSSEDANGSGDGNTDEDYEIRTNSDGTIDVYVRAERSGNGDGRTYTISISSTDDAGNTASASMTASVAHDQGNNGKKEATKPGKKGKG